MAIPLSLLDYLLIGLAAVAAGAINAIAGGEGVVEETPAVKEGGGPADRKTGGKMTTELGVNE